MTDAGAREISEALLKVAEAINGLGLNKANTPMGAIELLAKEIKDGTNFIAGAIQELHDGTL